MVREVAQHVIVAGGKRFRPLLVVLGSHLGPAAVDADVERAAVVVELTHVASLYHDDVMDEAALRRGAVSANARWGNTVAILVGDLLFARASDLVADLGPEFVRLQARTFARLVQGQIAETVGPGPGPGPAAPLPAGRLGQDGLADRHLRAVRRQARRRQPGGAADHGRLRRADRRRLPAERRHHRHHERRDGQDAGHRPARRHPDPAHAPRPCVDRPGGRQAADAARLRPQLRRRAGRGPRLLRRHRSIDEARADVRRRAESARLLLDGLPSGPARASLEELCDTVVSRTV